MSDSRNNGRICSSPWSSAAKSAVRVGVAIAMEKGRRVASLQYMESCAYQHEDQALSYRNRGILKRLLSTISLSLLIPPGETLDPVFPNTLVEVDDKRSATRAVRVEVRLAHLAQVLRCNRVISGLNWRLRSISWILGNSDAMSVWL